MTTPSPWKFYSYKYIDDTGNAWSIVVSDRLAQVGGLDEFRIEEGQRVGPIGRNYKPRYFKLVALDERPRMQKYRTDVITNERDPSKLLNKIITVDGIEMRCFRYVGEQRTGY